MNQLFIDTVRKTGGNNAKRLLIVAGYTTDIDKTCRSEYRLPKDTVPGKLFISVHYYTPWQFVGLNEDASWGKMMPTWGSDEDVKQLNELFDRMNDFCVQQRYPGVHRRVLDVFQQGGGFAQSGGRRRCSMLR